MFYYIVENSIVVTENEFDKKFYNYQELNNNQIQFYLKNLNAKVVEILACKLDDLTKVTLEDVKHQKLIELENNYWQKINNGYYNTDFNIALKLEDYDINKFANLLTMLKALEDLGQTTNEVQIADISNQLHTFNVLNLKILLVSYGIYYQTIWAENIRKTNIINSETDLAKLVEMDINNI